MKLLPHRYPFLLIDKIIDIDGNNSATGIKNVTVNEPHFTGHFPDRPIMPGVLIVEAMAQTAGRGRPSGLLHDNRQCAFPQTRDPRRSSGNPRRQAASARQCVQIPLRGEGRRRPGGGG
ncbi:hypothetical protein Lal_00010618 [Lupinus albus]|nr:hypothetical protein Lal_00010618 [Lupinus albus]